MLAPASNPAYRSEPVIWQRKEFWRRPLDFSHPDEIPGQDLPWSDDWFSKQTLKDMLDAENDIGTRPPDCIERESRWLLSILEEPRNHHLLDIGCGPGLYAEIFSRAGMKVTGIDLSPAAIEYARTSAAKAGLDITYVCGSISELNATNAYTAAFANYGFINNLHPALGRDSVEAVYRALAPDGVAVFELLHRGTLNQFAPLLWETVDNSYFSSQPHLYLQEMVTVDATSCHAFLTYVFNPDLPDEIRVYRYFFVTYTDSEFRELLGACGFETLNTHDYRDVIADPGNIQSTYYVARAKKSGD
ncbi:MAG: methyltransferase domain-containing protein [Chlorobi bacterium]|nr:methyltransferase domain-containing protein [Chlorobiota bacterium]